MTVMLMVLVLLLILGCMGCGSLKVKLCTLDTDAQSYISCSVANVLKRRKTKV